MDPIVGRDDEIRQIIDVLLRRRQNNPILTGEAGVGKTAVVEGFAQRLAAGDVPPQLKGNRLMALDIGLMQAGASMKGEFEQRLRSVIDEVQGSPTPIILFIDEVHTLIGAGGQAGTGDAANLLKPALARGTLRTIGATTWTEYRQYIEKDPALTRRFQPVNVDEPSIEKAQYMLRGLLAPMEKHHDVRISDEAVVAAVELSRPLHPGAPAARQGGEPARHRLRARRHLAVDDAGRDRRPQGRDQRAREGARGDRGAERHRRRQRRGAPTSSTAEIAEINAKLADLEGKYAKENADRRRDRQAARAARRGEEGGKGRRSSGRGRRTRPPAPASSAASTRRSVGDRDAAALRPPAPAAAAPASRHPEAALRPRLTNSTR